MMRRAVPLAGVLLLAVIVMQLVPVARTNPAVVQDIAAPPDVQAVLRHACYDCHSHETVWPWYSRVAPVSWLITHDVNEGREELDFSTWSAYPPPKRGKKLDKAAKEVTEGEMPPWYYRLLHPEARLSEAEAALIVQWLTAERGKLPR
ncbi:MAG: heme-binding domain-containing protein [Candidatus Binatia bacterium]